MIAGRTGDFATKLIPPLVYAATFVPAVVLNIAVIWHLDKYIMLVWPNWYMESNSPGTAAWLAAVVLSSLLVFGTVFGVYGWLLLLWERLRRPTILDHLRRCALLYAALLTLGSLLVVFADDDAGPGYSVALSVFFCNGYAVLIDALILLLKRWRFDRLEALGGGA